MYRHNNYSDFEFFLTLMLLLAITALWVAFGQWLWTIIAVNIFGLPYLNYWEFFGLRILLKTLLSPIPGSTKKDG